MKNDSLVKKKRNQNHFARSCLSWTWLIHGLTEEEWKKGNTTHVFISPPVDGHLSCFQFGIIINTVLQIFWYLEQWSPTFLARDRFPRRQLFYGWEWGGRFWDDSSTLHSLCTLSLLLSHQFHLGPSGMRFCRLGTPVLEHICRFFSVEGMKCCAQKSFERTHLDKCGW